MAIVCERGIPNLVMEAGISLLLAGLGLVALWDSRRIGMGWTDDGPQSGAFPFWIGLLLVAASTGNVVQALRSRRLHPEKEGLFLTWPQSRMVLSVLTPLVAYVFGIVPLGIYVASALLVAYCMAVLGKFPVMTAALSGIATAIVVFVTFEIWFLVALPKGPIEDMLGL